MTIQEIIDEESLNGLGATMLVFAQKRGIDKSTVGFSDGVKKITAEFSIDEEEKKLYPLSKSIKTEVFWAMEQGRPSFAALYAHGEEENLRKLIRTIVCGETLNVMKDCLDEVMKTFSQG